LVEGQGKGFEVVLEEGEGCGDEDSSSVFTDISRYGGGDLVLKMKTVGERKQHHHHHQKKEDPEEREEDQEEDEDDDDEHLFFITMKIPPKLWRVMQSSLLSPLASQTIRICPIIFSQGINEQQSKAIMLGETSLQEEMNHWSLGVLEEYLEDYMDWLKNWLLWGERQKGDEERIDEGRENGKEESKAQPPLSPSSSPSQAELRAQYIKLKDQLHEFNRTKEIVLRSRREKNTQILPKIASLVQWIEGCRFTSCKSAKDRTSMSITWEMARILQRYHSVPSDRIFEITDVLRSEGLRLENAWKNTGKKKFAFNKLQRSMIPEEYRAPADACAEGKIEN